MPNILTPTVTNNVLSVSAIMGQPTGIRAKIAELTEGNELLSTFFTQLGAPVQGGGILHPRLSGAERYTADDVVERAPGDEYQTVRAIDPEYRLAAVRDYGAKTTITDEEIARNDISALNNKVSQLTSTLVRKLNVKALAAIDAATPATLATTYSWEDFLTVGPADSITPNSQRPLADLLRIKRMFADDRFGFIPDTLAVSPQDAENLGVGYGAELESMLTTASLKMLTNPYIPAGKVYVVQAGKPGVVGYESPLTIDIIDKRETREKILQVYAVPALAVDRPQAVKIITGTVTP